MRVEENRVGSEMTLARLGGGLPPHVSLSLSKSPFPRLSAPLLPQPTPCRGYAGLLGKQRALGRVRSGWGESQAQLPLPSIMSSTLLWRKGQLPSMQCQLQSGVLLSHKGLQMKRERQDVLTNLGRSREVFQLFHGLVTGCLAIQKFHSQMNHLIILTRDLGCSYTVVTETQRAYEGQTRQ